ncbi:hypothetical protein G3480_19085 [Thiorhodococcus mannitoliphagus]|uniref:Uncharacterized protein n=1 Tax=Thiorhodococcus mannitoliphagus TaxID=329406 RepID=A0A6P1E3X6_9GAMM|nr:hypothetical protein [Thiorhodococcus mannitoliphagus]NEX22385.1 hypothetical protein [Thiorhodococcus mannitoliphagus]
MFDSYNDGECPQCKLAPGPAVAMELNREDHWECPVCHLQMLGSGGQVLILRERGSGNFKEPRVLAPHSIVGAFMCRQSTEDPWGSGGYFRSAEDLRTFLEQEVDAPDSTED